MRWIAIQGDGYCRWARVDAQGKEIADAPKREPGRKLDKREQDSTGRIAAPLTPPAITHHIREESSPPVTLNNGADTIVNSAMSSIGSHGT